MRERLIVVMPVYNEAGCLEAVLGDWVTAMKAAGGGEIIVVDDGSTDGTTEILNRLAAGTTGIHAYRQINAGHGSAVLRGYRWAIDQGSDWVFQTDSDGEIGASDFARLWSQRSRSPFLLASRIHRTDHPVRVWLSGVHRTLVQALFGVSIPDPNVPFRLMRGELLTQLLPLVPPDTFAPNVLLSILAARRGLDTINIEVEHRPRRAGVASIRGWKAVQIGWRWAKQLLAFQRSLGLG